MEGFGQKLRRACINKPMIVRVGWVWTVIMRTGEKNAVSVEARSWEHALLIGLREAR